MTPYSGQKANNFLLSNLLIFAFFCFTIVGCDDDDDDPGKREMITKSWQTEFVSVNGIDTTSGFQDTEITFQDDGGLTTTQTVDFGSGDTTITLNGTWQFQNDQQSLFVANNVGGGQTDTTNFDILKLESDALWLEETRDNGNIWEWRFIPL